MGKSLRPRAKNIRYKCGNSEEPTVATFLFCRGKVPPTKERKIELGINSQASEGHGPDGGANGHDY